MRVLVTLSLVLSTFIYLFYNFHLKKRIENRIQPLKFTKGFPNIVFRSIGNLTVPNSLHYHCYKKWEELNPDFTFLCYTNKDCDRFMEQYYKGDVLEAYKNLKPWAYKIDLWRLCILYKFGGYYIDTFATPYVNMKEMTQDCNCNFISILDSSLSGNGIHNGLIISKKGHPFLKQGITDIVQNVKKQYYGHSSLSVTGPLALSKSVNKILGNFKNTHSKGLNNHGNLSYYLYSHEWGPYQNIYKNGKLILSKYYSFLYYLYRKNISKGAYHRMWKNKDIYIKKKPTSHSKRTSLESYNSYHTSTPKPQEPSPAP